MDASFFIRALILSAFSFLIGACVVYQSDGRKAMEDGGSFTIPIQADRLQTAQVYCRELPKLDRVQLELKSELMVPPWTAYSGLDETTGIWWVVVEETISGQSCRFPSDDPPMEPIGGHVSASREFLELLNGEF